MKNLLKNGKEVSRYHFHYNLLSNYPLPSYVLSFLAEENMILHLLIYKY